jgi:curved DNA-binding protein CbpA
MGMLSPEALVERADEIRERAATIDDQDLFKMLGLGRDSTPDEARAAFFQLAKKWHPDKLHVDLEHVRAELAKVFARLSEAHATLTDPEKRERYLRLYDQGGGTPKQQAEVAQLLEASTAYQKGAWFVGKGNFAEAEPFAMRAYELAPKEPDHVALYCWLLAQKPERRAAGKYDDLLFKLDAALAESPNCESGLYYRGMIRKLAGRTEGALADFRAVVAHNPKHLDAQREVRLFEMRKQQAAEQKAKDDAGGGLLGRFMKKK